MIARVWKGVAQGSVNADAYLRHLDANVMPMDAVRRFFDDFVRHYEVER